MCKIKCRVAQLLCAATICFSLARPTLAMGDEDLIPSISLRVEQNETHCNDKVKFALLFDPEEVGIDGVTFVVHRIGFYPRNRRGLVVLPEAEKLSFGARPGDDDFESLGYYSAPHGFSGDQNEDGQVEVHFELSANRLGLYLVTAECHCFPIANKVSRERVWVKSVPAPLLVSPRHNNSGEVVWDELDAESSHSFSTLEELKANESKYVIDPKVRQE
jgi:hypothetical protein